MCRRKRGGEKNKADEEEESFVVLTLEFLRPVITLNLAIVLGCQIAQGLIETCHEKNSL